MDFGFFGVGSKGLEMRKMMQGASQKTILGNREVRRHQNVQWQIGFSKSINQNIEQQMYVPLSLHLHLSCQAHPLLPPKPPPLIKRDYKQEALGPYLVWRSECNQGVVCAGGVGGISAVGGPLRRRAPTKRLLSQRVHHVRAPASSVLDQATPENSHRVSTI